MAHRQDLDRDKTPATKLAARLGQAAAWARVLLVPALAIAGCQLDEQGTLDASGPPDVVAIDALDANEAGADQVADVGAEADGDGAAPFTPSQLGGLVLWLRSDTGVSLDAQNRVQSWADQSASGIIANQPVASLRPEYGIHTINGQTTVTFVASNQDVLVLSSFPALTQAHAFVVHERVASAPPTSVASGFWGLTGNPGYGACVPYVDGIVYDDFGTSFRRTGAAPPTSMAIPNVYEVISTPSQWTLLQNGAQFYTTSSNTVSFAQTPHVLGGDAVGGNYYDGDWAEIAIYDHQLSTSDRSRLIAYFDSRYNISAN